MLLVVRSPRIERAETSYDGVVDFGAVIEKEAAALRLMAAEGIPVPQVLGVEFDDPVLHREQAARATALAERIVTAT